MLGEMEGNLRFPSNKKKKRKLFYSAKKKGKEKLFRHAPGDQYYQLILVAIDILLPNPDLMSILRIKSKSPLGRLRSKRVGN